VIVEHFYPLKNLRDEPTPRVKYPLFEIPTLAFFEVRDRGFREADGDGRQRLLQSEPCLRVDQRDLPAGLEIGQPRHDGAHKGTFLLGLLVVGDGLHHCNPMSTARQEYRTVSLRRVFDNSARMDLQVREWHDIFGKFHSHGSGLRISFDSLILAPMKSTFIRCDGSDVRVIGITASFAGAGVDRALS